MKIWRKPYFLWLVVILLAIFIVLAVYFFIPQNSVLPTDFLAARQNAAQVSQKIVDFTTATNQKISAANSLDLKNEIEPALNLIQEARTDNNAANAQSSSLAQSLQQMAAALNGIRPINRQQLAYQAVAIELSLVSEFIVYTQQINSFLDALSQAIGTHSLAERQVANNYLNLVNSQAEKINGLNNEFLSAIQAFDKIK